jgi:2-polyprenyl-6-methoxyphenol hydroxylase-like FAD-dependent oxidoreductase
MTSQVWDADVIITGGGPAGSACATFLARRGVRVLLLTFAARRWRPVEILSPATIRLLRHHRLSIPRALDGAATCRGVEGWWDDEVGFFDYEIYACGAGIAVPRAALDTALLADARAAGATVVVEDARIVATDREANGTWSVTIGGSRRATSARLLIEAVGRGGRNLADTSARRHLDRLIAFACRMQLEPATCQIMLLEASTDGWWYSSCDARGDGAAVLLTDRDLLPLAPEERERHFRRAFGATRLLRARLPGLPERLELHGIDARTSRRERFSGPASLCIGDAAYSIDPLSGAGIQRAIETAAQAAVAAEGFVHAGDATSLADYASWAETDFARWFATKTSVYATADPRLFGETFWSRRDVIAGSACDDVRGAPAPE